jgi:hypothetical protein
MVDFGMMGTVTAPVCAVLVEILLALATKDSMRSAVALRGVGIVLKGPARPEGCTNSSPPHSTSRVPTKVPMGELDGQRAEPS